MKTTRPLRAFSALLALAGLSGMTPSMALTNAASPPSMKHLLMPPVQATQTVSKRSLAGFGRGYSTGLFKHSHLSQRQRRKFNRQRHAAGDKKAFA